MDDVGATRPARRRRRDPRGGAQRGAGGQTAVALRALLDAVRLGDVRAGDAIGRLSAECDCATGRLALAHGRALAARDAAALAEVSQSYAAAGWHGAAADAAAQSDEHR